MRNYDALVFQPNEVKNLLEIGKVMVWEEADGSGKPIELTPREYFDRFVYNQSFEDPDEILVNEIKQRGNTKNNIKEAFPNSHVVEFYRSGTEENGGMDLGKY